ncbi:hypothetical protein HPC49_24450 [Pyxidicoccus fallax]|uniref:Lipoprotein n=1 Tax=Pyxidicoccus fallax TaxID=394095 RepID=A0A848LS04_9BACT|nr:hypothetical protein [Pyxidicoccus fallax]NMO20471.1 hypothetical protein [Pyxidicoccus fallax]NPC81368.1 hypothetical protein [Pyxidicoccus fallax]
MSRTHGSAVVVLAMLALVVVSSEARADEVVYQFRSEEDPASPPDPAVCAQAPFAVTVKLGGSLYVPVHRLRDGKVVYEGRRRVGRATACVRLTDPTFPPGQQVPFYARFSLPDGNFTALGTCTLVSNDVPQAGLVLAGCALKLVDVPKGFVGGTVSSTSVFNPAGLPGCATGSYYTLYAYRDGHRRDASEQWEAWDAALAEARAEE